MNGINQIKYLSQRDPQWAMVKMGTSQTTLGAKGCLVTDLSMLTDYFGCYQTPAQIAQNSKNFQNDNLNWIALDFPTFSFRAELNNPFETAPVDMNIVKAWIEDPSDINKADRAVILEVSNHTHWVLPLWYTATGDILAIDPWIGKTCNVFEDYHNVTNAALFVRWDKTKHGGKQAWQGQGNPQAPLYN
jgi:hypothetical protein